MLNARTIAMTTGLLASAAALAQTPFYSNASPSPSTPALNAQSATFSGVPAPGAFQWSECPALGIFESNATAGVACHTDSTGGLRVADDVVLTDFTVIGTMWVYVYQPGFSGPGSPVSAGTLRIWQGRPGDAGSVVLFGDATNDRMIAAEPTNIARVFTTRTGPAFVLPATDRQIYRVTLSASSVVLPPGTYWFDWQLTPTTPGAMLFTPTATLANARSQAGWNAIQWSSVNGSWQPIVDPGKPGTVGDAAMDLAFILVDSQGQNCDSMDFNNDTLVPDSGDLDDFLAVLAGGPAACSTFPTPGCNDLDFNNDGFSPDSLDLDAFISRLGGGPCLQ